VGRGIDVPPTLIIVHFDLVQHPLHSSGLLRMDQPTENPASKALQDCCVVAYCCVTMEMKSTIRVLDTDICLLLLMWELSSHRYLPLVGFERAISVFGTARTLNFLHRTVLASHRGLTGSISGCYVVLVVHRVPLGLGFLGVFRFPLPIYIPPNSAH
jgi:hypothetical protein